MVLYQERWRHALEGKGMEVWGGEGVDKDGQV